MFKTSREFFLRNGDKCTTGQYVIARMPDTLGTTLTARVEEILTIKNSVADFSGKPDHILLQAADLNLHKSDTYHMPCIRLDNRWGLLRFEVSTMLHFEIITDKDHVN